MDELDHLKEQLALGRINRRQFVRGAVALGMTAAAAVSFVREAVAGDFEDGKKMFPVRRQKKIDPKFAKRIDKKNKIFNRNNANHMFNYGVLKFKTAGSEASGWLGYAYSVKFSESWTFDALLGNAKEAGWNNTELETEATKLAKNAMDAGADYDSHWAYAIVLSNFGHADMAVKEYEKAIMKEGADSDKDFLFEMADAYVLAGRVDDALALIGGLSPTEDWHLHELAWCYYFKENYDKALELLGRRKYKHKDRRTKHIALPELLAAVCHARMGNPTGMKQSMDRFQYDWGEAGNSTKHPNFSKWTVKKARRYAAFSAGATPYEEHWVDGVMMTTLK